MPGDLELVRERVHPATMAAEGPLHELGAIAITNSDSPGMGRIMETLRRTVQFADAMKPWRATEVGSLRPGRLADVVLWKPAFFGAKPELVLKAGFHAWGPLG